MFFWQNEILLGQMFCQLLLLNSASPSLDRLGCAVPRDSPRGPSLKLARLRQMWTGHGSCILRLLLSPFYIYIILYH